MKFSNYQVITNPAGIDTVLIHQQSSNSEKQVALTDISESATSGVINVRDYGALGDGVTDDTSAIQAALNSAAQYDAVYFPPSTGAYIVTSVLSIPVSNLTIFGFRAKISGLNDSQFEYFTASTLDGIKIHGLDFASQWSGGGSSSSGSITLNNCTNSVIRDCVFTGIKGVGVNILTGSGISVLDSNFSTIGYGVVITGQNVTVSRNLIQVSSGFCVWILGSAANILVSCNQLNASVAGVTAPLKTEDTANKIIIKDNIVFGAGFGLLIGDALGDNNNSVLISGNDIKTDQTGIAITNSYAVTVEGNLIAAFSGSSVNAIAVEANDVIAISAVNSSIQIKNNTFKGTWTGRIIAMFCVGFNPVIEGIEISGNNTSSAIGTTAAISYAGTASRLRAARIFDNRGDILDQAATINLSNDLLVTSSTATIVIPNVKLYAVNATGGAKSITLPDATMNSGLEIGVMKTDASGNAVTVVGTINGAANNVLAARYDYGTYKSNGTDWYIVNHV